ncbi:hypothetical protein LLEC1_06470 [Akanthomyces lecanii]|uniref:Major facilitator superfamily (MFS) profile domain-containing protein n=1 Tax=Cordyceps confragosa TaxID=2714763 RepID=A0A179IFN1_CORDF|nr:hypothetical protein LLEC1_06470 [Akanthomyces lecanii]
MTDHGDNEPLLVGASAERSPVSRRTFWRVVLLSYTMLFCSQLYASSFNTVLFETLEGLLCRDMFGDVGDPLADPRCKGEAVQSELSLLTSIEASFEMIPPMVCGIVYGLVADVYGRRPILMLSTFGAVLYGALDIAICMFVFMSHCGMVVGFFAACLMPETITIGEKTHDTVDDAAPFSKKLSARVAELRAQSVSSLRDMFWGGNTKLTLLLFSTLFTGVGKQLVGSVMKQYAVKRYELSWARAGIILSYANLLRLGLCFLGIPLLTTALRRAKVLPITQDAWISRISVLVAVVCSCLAGAATDVGDFTVSIVLYAFSYCLEPTVRSLVVSMGRGAGTGSIVSAMEVLTAVSIAIAGPIIAATFRLGMKLGGDWIGLPMYIGGGIMVPGALILWLMRFDEEIAEELAEESEGLL